MSIDCTLQRRCISNTEQNSRPIIYKTDHSIWNTSLLSISALYLSKVPGPDFSIASLLYILTLFPKNKKIKKKKKDYLLYFLKKKPTHAHEKLVHLSSTFICHFPLIYIEIIHFTIKSPILWWSRKCTCFYLKEIQLHLHLKHYFYLIKGPSLPIQLVLKHFEML